MSRRFPIGWAIFALVVVTAIPAWFFYSGGEIARWTAVRHMAVSPSRIDLRLTIRYDRPPIYVEQYILSDINGISTSSYRIRAYSGKQITVKALPDRVYAVSFFFGKLEQDGIWKLMNRSPRPHAVAHYTLFVKQIVQYQSGQRTVTFTSPHYWATIASHKYEINLNKGVPNANQFVFLKSRALADKRYEEIVTAFRHFGSPEFRRKVAAARAEILRDSAHKGAKHG
ncbi:MAG: hypothetical protein ACYDHD_06915 [Vulcanimicrobiaceae bacterium]